MEWYDAVEAAKPHVVQISTPRGSGSGFFVSASAASDMCAVATAAHVVADSNWWEEPIRLFQPSSGQSRILRHSDRAIEFRYDADTAAILFNREALPLPPVPLPSIPEGQFLKVGNEVGWLGFPAISPMDLCFFSGRVSAWRQRESAYLIDGVVINGVSGGPMLSVDLHPQPALVGVVSAYIPNLATGESLPGLSVVRDVKQFHELANRFRNLGRATQQQGPARPPGGGEIPSRRDC